MMHKVEIIQSSEANPDLNQMSELVDKNIKTVITI